MSEQYQLMEYHKELTAEMNQAFDWRGLARGSWSRIESGR